MPQKQEMAAAGPDIFIIAGESSGDELGAGLIDALRASRPGARFRGVGGPAMLERGFQTLFPMTDIAVMGVLPVLRNLRRLSSRINTTATAAIGNPPDILIIIDSPDFTHRVARKLRARRPQVPIINYVSPTVWAWRPGRARKMKPYVDHLLALLPFEPAAHERLGGPPCTYVGHPLVERFAGMNDPGRRAEVERGRVPDRLLVLPGSRRSEVHRLMPLFREILTIVKSGRPELHCLLPAVAHVEEDIRNLALDWPAPLEIVRGEQAKYEAMRSARAALAASGTVSLELALARLPFVLAYRLSFVEAAVARHFILTRYAGLPSNILGRELNPEFLQEYAVPAKVASAVSTLLAGGEERDAQLRGFEEVDRTMQLPPGKTPSVVAASIVERYLN